MKRSTLILSIGLLAVVLVGMGCNASCENCKDEAPSAAAAAQPSESASTDDLPCCCFPDATAKKSATEEKTILAAAEAPPWGTIKGQAVFAGGPAPAAKEVTVTKDGDHCLSKGPINSEEWVVNPKNKGVRWAFVWLAPEGDAKLPIHPDLAVSKSKTAEMDQPCCKFIPHALAMRADQKWLIKNSASITHNVNYVGGIKNQGDNKLMPPGSQLEIDLNASMTPVKIACNIHGWMNAWVRVYDHPYFALTDADGKFEIKNAPAGKFRLIAWHESVGWLLGEDGKLTKTGIPIEIKAGETTEVRVDVKPSE